MARSPKRKTKNGWSYTATVRIKEHPSVSCTFDTKGKASAHPVHAKLTLLSNLFIKAKKERGIPVDNPVT